jgi:hypothetical protein
MPHDFGGFKVAFRAVRAGGGLVRFWTMAWGVGAAEGCVVTGFAVMRAEAGHR